MKKITIINAYGDNNIGDAAILIVSLQIIDKIFSGKVRISILCESFNSSKLTLGSIIKTHKSPYGYAIRSENKQVPYIIKVIRMIKIFLFSLLYVIIGNINLKILPNKGFYQYIKLLKESDVVIGCGGGYLRTKNKFRDNFGLFLTLLPIWITTYYRTKLIFFPMSFGNFASGFHTILSYNAIKDSKLLIREDISSNLIKKFSKNKDIDIELFPDLALFLEADDQVSMEEKMKSKYVVLTARAWFSFEKQIDYENSLKLIIEYIWNKYNLKTVFIPMVHNKIEEDDNVVAFRIRDSLINKEFFSIINPSDPREVQKILMFAKFSICTRMHSAILSTTVQTPFICIAYEHKTRGLLKGLDLLEWNINIESINYKILKEKVDTLMKDFVYKKYFFHLIQQHYSIVSKMSIIENSILEYILK